ncbi:VOC family protein [Nocardioides nanhaiensis]|uniref:VOC family protein n=1 Tax=Nocardioides nanhaiensis TaxID=1476871 RepID=A0ABP8WCD0_9ACTN
MALIPGQITINSTDPAALAGWWAERLGGGVADTFGPDFLFVHGGTLGAVSLAFQRVEELAVGQRIHLDFSAPDLEAEVAALEAAGATVVGRRGDEHFAWVTFADPQGNEFCVAAQAEAEAAYETEG